MSGQQHSCPVVEWSIVFSAMRLKKLVMLVAIFLDTWSAVIPRSSFCVNPSLEKILEYCSLNLMIPFELL